MSANLYITATRPGEGKTAITLGVLAALKAQAPGIGYIKPVGSRDIDRGDYSLDQDTLLLAKSCQITGHLQDANPVTIKRGFSDRPFDSLQRRDALARILKSYLRVSRNRELVVIEGFGHAAVGSNLGLSNALLASRLNAKVVLVTSGALRHPVDELVLNKVFFEQHGVELLGVIINKVSPANAEVIRKHTRKVLERLGITLLGAVPRIRKIDTPTMIEIRGDLEAQVFSGRQNLSNRHRRALVGAMTAQEAFGRLAKMPADNLLITAGDRTDLVIAALVLHQRRAIQEPHSSLFSGIILTGGIAPHENIRPLLRESDIPVLLVDNDSYTTASRIKEMIVPIDPADRGKIERIKRVVRRNVDIEKIRAELGVT